jgi:hypothetical protein
MTFLDFAEKIITREEKALTQAEIWELGTQNGFNKDLNTKGVTPWQTLGAAIRKDIRDNKNTRFIKTEDSPLRFYLKSLPEIVVSQQQKSTIHKKSNDKNKFFEKELHKFLSYFVYEQDKIFTKTINAQKSTKWINSIWRHPDIVGVAFPDWETDVLEISKEIESYGIKFYSYELKRELNTSNLREHYFEAVSNSSWANEGYLVASKISEENEFMEELKRLNNAFGIGLIQISLEDPSSNKIIFQARYKENIDIDSINILSKINNDFKEFLKDVKADFNSTRGIKGNYDKIIEVEELYKKQ